MTDWVSIATALDNSEEWGLFIADLYERSVAGFMVGERNGQSFMNALWEVRPDLHTLLTGSACDPFYNDSNLPAAVAVMYDNFLQEEA